MAAQTLIGIRSKDNFDMVSKILKIKMYSKKTGIFEIDLAMQIEKSAKSIQNKSKLQLLRLPWNEMNRKWLERKIQFYKLQWFQLSRKSSMLGRAEKAAPSHSYLILCCHFCLLLGMFLNCSQGWNAAFKTSEYTKQEINISLIKYHNEAYMLLNS